MPTRTVRSGKTRSAVDALFRGPIRPAAEKTDGIRGCGGVRQNVSERNRRPGRQSASEGSNSSESANSYPL